MPYCPNCGTEYASGVARCQDCGATLAAGPAESRFTGLERPERRPALLAEFTDMVQLDLVETQLRAAGIATARRPRAVAVFVPAWQLEDARRIASGGAPRGVPSVLGLSELHRIRLVCEECGEAASVDLISEQVPASCACGHYFDLLAARPVLDRYRDLMRTMAEADFEIEIEAPQEETEQGAEGAR